jgi:hypothetical protein
MMTDKIRKQILEGFIDIFTRIASKEYQKRVWINGVGPEVDDFDDTVCDFFQESDSIIENYKDFGITEDQYHYLKNFYAVFRAFADQNNWPPKFIDSLEWDRITKMAQKVLQSFHYKKSRNL